MGSKIPFQVFHLVIMWFVRLLVKLIFHMQRLPKIVKQKIGRMDWKRAWVLLFGRKHGGKSSFPPVTSKSYWEKGDFQIFIPDQIVDFSITSMEYTLVGKFLGARPDIDTLKNMLK